MMDRRWLVSNIVKWALALRDKLEHQYYYLYILDSESVTFRSFIGYIFMYRHFQDRLTLTDSDPESRTEVRMY